MGHLGRMARGEERLLVGVEGRVERNEVVVPAGERGGGGLAVGEQ